MKSFIKTCVYMICFSVSIAFADQEKLYDAATLGDEAQVKQLLAAGDSPNKPNSMGSYPLHGAVLSGHLKIVELLIKNGADVNLKDPLTQQNTLSNGGYGNLAITKVLVQSGVDINQQGSNQGRILPSPLLWAVLHNNDEVALFLLDKGADPTLKDFKERTALTIAKTKNKTPVIAAIEAALKKQNKK